MSVFSRSAAQCLAASVVLVSLCSISYRLHFNLATVALLLMIVVVLVARLGSFFSSVFASIIAVLCLAHIAPPAFSFRVDDPLDDVAVIAFLITSLIIARLMSTVRKQAEEALSSVSSRVIEAEEQERQRIAKDLHENIGQRVTMLYLQIEKLKRDSLNVADAHSQLDVLLKQSSEILTDVQASAHELYSPRLEYLGLAGVMSSYCRDFGAQKGVEINFKSDGLPSHVPTEIALCLFRVLQEALHNAVKHSGVRQFDARLWATSDEIHLTVGDCGVGFDLDTTSKARGLGLHRMQERLKLVKGSVFIDSQPQRGTTIHARVPLSSGSGSMRVPWGQLS
jgi:signal transduction histidine kinase